MKHCPQCNRVETDETLKFCRIDGATLISDSSSFSSEAGTAQLVSSADMSEVHTSVLPRPTAASVNPTTGPTTVLPSQPGVGTTKDFQITTGRRLNTKVLVAVAIAIIALVSALIFILYRNRSTSAPIQSIAVIPFVNASNNADVEYLSDGMTETLINSLSQLPNLTVKARSSVFRYKGKEVDPQTVGAELNVAAILNGRVIQRGDDLTLYLSLVDTNNGNQLWGDQYSRKTSDLVALQNEISRDVATKLRNKLSGTEVEKVATTYTQNTEAYQLYLQGRFFANKRTRQSIEKAIEYYQQAITKDPNYALGYAGLSDAYGLLLNYGGAPASEALSRAREAALRSLSLDPSLAEAHHALGYVLVTTDFDYAGAEREYRRAIELNPNFTQAHHNFGLMLFRTGRSEEGMAEIRRALELEPFSIIANRVYGEMLTFSRRYDEGLAQLKKTLEMDPTFSSTYLALSTVYRLMGKHAESVEAFAKFHELNDRPQTAALARSSFASGGWQTFLREMSIERPEGPSRFTRAICFLELGEKDKAFAELNKALDNRDYPMRFLKVDPSVDTLRNDPRFKDLLQRMRMAG